MEFRPGTLVTLYDREWVVLPSPDNELIMLRPLGGSEAEIRSVWKKLSPEFDQIKEHSFEFPTVRQYADFASARLLFDATRLSFRNGAGPFRLMGKLSFRPRAYQLVPLIMALRQKTVRLMIADDVGIGKTIESLLIVREMLDRAYIDRFAVLAPPHLCDQWQKEIFDKFAIDAKLVRSSTLSSLERDLLPNESIFDHYPFTVISIDLIKGDRYRSLFLNKCPPLVICDEAHTCAGSSGEAHLRHRLVADISLMNDKHLILLTATPHSGKQEQFQSLLGLIKPEFIDVDMANANDKRRREVAKHFVQRRRKNIEKWMNEDTKFPERDSRDIAYELSANYQKAFDSVLKFARSYSKSETDSSGKSQIRYYAALTLLRGVISSPASGAVMLANRAKRLGESLDAEDQSPINFVVENDEFSEGDFEPVSYIEEADFGNEELKILKELRQKLNECKGLTNDKKAKTALEILKDWLGSGFNPVVYCRFINTAKYLGELLKPELEREFKKNIAIEVITSELSDEERSEKIKSLEPFSKKIVFATDCMSEGINLQEQFTAVMHYDLPWNPNRIEQREGRIDRFGQTADKIKIVLLHCEKNPIDEIVINVLMKKISEIKKASGISVPFPESSESILKAVLNAVLLKSGLDEAQPAFDFGEEYEQEILKKRLNEDIQTSADREKAISSIFAQESIKPAEIEQDLIEVDEALGKPENVKQFVLDSIQRLSCSYSRSPKGFNLQLVNADPSLRLTLTDKQSALVSFESPTPEGHIYLGRNHPFVEQLCNAVMKRAFGQSDQNDIGRFAVIRSEKVEKPTTIYLIRLRLVIRDTVLKADHLAEEVYVTGFEDFPVKNQFLNYEKAKYLLTEYSVSGEVEDDDTRGKLLEISLNDFESIQEHLMKVTIERTKKLIDAHERFRKAIGGEKYNVVEPVLPPDLLGVFIILPAIKS